jgi:hypothetical protein
MATSETSGGERTAARAAGNGSPAAGVVDTATAATQIKAALRGSVITALAEGIPEVRSIGGTVAYEKVMGDLGLLERCFAYFRAERDRFKAVLVDERHQQVDDDTTRLSCGRTLAEVIAMIVRTAALRYFVKRLGGVRPLKHTPQQKAGFLAKVVAALRGESKPAPIQSSKSRAELLYEAIREFLLHEWQVPLVPAYSQLTPGEVARLGPRLAELRSEGELMSAVGRPVPAPVAATPASPSTSDVLPESGALDLADVLNDERTRLRVAVIEETLQDQEVRDAANNAEQTGALKSLLRQVNAGLVKALVVELGLNKKQMIVCLLTAQKLMLPSAFEKLARSLPNSASVRQLLDAIKSAGLGPQSSLEDCAACITAVYSGPKGGADKR